MTKNQYAFVFAAIVCLSCSLVLALASQGLKERQELNRKVDLQRNILRSVGIVGEPGAPLTSEQVLEAYTTSIKEVVVDTNGSVVSGMVPAAIREGDTEHLPVFVQVDKGTVGAYVFPTSGKGLWSTIYGYVALQPDAVTIKGISFYKHGETPGLGGEVAESWFQDNFVGKRIFDQFGDLTSVVVAKGKAKDVASEADQDHYVDGISGATFTGKGVTAFLKSDLTRYEPFLKSVQQQPLEF